MAYLQPENIPSRNDLPDRLQQVARAFRDLVADEVTVWLERTGDGEVDALRREFDAADSGSTRSTTEPYLVVLDPESGIAVVEAPAPSRRRRSAARRIAPGTLQVEISRRARELRKGLDAGPIRDLPVVHVEALPEVTRAELPAGTAGRVLSRENFTPGALRPALQSLIGGRSLPLNAAQETEARVTVKPSIRIGGEQRLMFRPPDDEETVRALDRRQERLAEHLGGGYRLIRGVAGSGKTLVLTHRAKHFATLLPQWRILLLCYNRALANALDNEVGAVPNVEAMTVDTLASRLLKAAGRPRDHDGRRATDDDYERWHREAQDAVGTLADSEFYDMVLVDEAQDLGPSGMDLAWAVLRDGRDHFVMALDSAQNLYRRRMAWNPPGMTARGRTTVLATNYRNTREILEWALGVLPTPEDAGTGDPQSDQLDVLVMPESAVRRGELPRSIVCGDLEGEARAIAERVRELLADGAEPEHVVVISGSRELRELLLETVPDSVNANKLRDKGVTARGKVRVATLHWSKGLEVRHVIVGASNDVWVPKSDEDYQLEQTRRLLYVAMTRATRTLTVTRSGEGPMDSVRRVPVVGLDDLRDVLDGDDSEDR